MRTKFPDPSAPTIYVPFEGGPPFITSFNGTSISLPVTQVKHIVVPPPTFIMLGVMSDCLLSGVKPGIYHISYWANACLEGNLEGPAMPFSYMRGVGRAGAGTPLLSPPSHHKFNWRCGECLYTT